MVGDFEWVKLGDPLEAHTILKDLTQNIGTDAWLRPPVLCSYLNVVVVGRKLAIRGCRRD
jgi:hypothetical protein